LWHVSCRLFPHNALFRHRFVTLGGPQLAYMLLFAASEEFLAVDCGSSTKDIRVAMFYGQDERSHVHERSLLLFIHCTLSVCLQCSSLDADFPQQVNCYFLHLANYLTSCMM